MRVERVVGVVVGGAAGAGAAALAFNLGLIADVICPEGVPTTSCPSRPAVAICVVLGVIAGAAIGYPAGVLVGLLRGPVPPLGTQRWLMVAVAGALLAPLVAMGTFVAAAKEGMEDTDPDRSAAEVAAPGMVTTGVLTLTAIVGTAMAARAREG